MYHSYHSQSLNTFSFFVWQISCPLRYTFCSTNSFVLVPDAVKVLWIIHPSRPYAFCIIHSSGLGSKNWGASVSICEDMTGSSNNSYNVSSPKDVLCHYYCNFYLFLIAGLLFHFHYFVSWPTLSFGYIVVFFTVTFDWSLPAISAYLSCGQ